ncbi:SDR family oxidoreductase [Halobellus rubicundus]|uniref:SDR family oxidoreductase n=1 Tax=Halobellus rubicundus TaxID=2996466 RepID=A0ABD5MHB2_9EURY
MTLTDATVVVTGASRGIGRALLGAFAGEGAAVVGCARDVDALDEAVADARATREAADAERDAPIEGVRADVRVATDVERAMDVADGIGPGDGVDVVVANAGVNHGDPGEMPIHEESYDRFDDTVQTNLRGVFAAAKEGLARMPADGRLLVPSGSVAVDAKPGMGAYAVSKAAAEAVIRQVAADADQTAAVVDPGIVETDLSGPGGRAPEDVAPMFVWAAGEADAEEIDGERVDLRTWKRATRSR